MTSADGAPSRPGGIAATASATLAVQVTTYALVFATSILVARGLGPVGRGQYYLPITAAAAAVVIVHLGLEGTSSVFVAERRATLSQVAAALTALAPLSGAAGAAGLIGLYALTRDSLFEGVPWEAFLVAPALLPLQIHTLWALNVFALGGRVVRAQFAQLAGAVAQVLLLLVLIVLGRLTLLSALGTYAVYIALPLAILVWSSRAFAPLRPAFDRSLIGRLVSFGLKLQFAQVFYYLLYRSDIFLVNLMLGSRDVGIYSLTVVLGEAVMLLTVPLVLAAVPVQAGLGSRDAGVFSFKASRFNGVFAIVLSALFAATMWLGIPLLYGDEFAEAYVALVALLPGIVAISVVRPLSGWLIRQDRPWLLSLLGIGAFAVNAALNLLLLPEMGIVGASVASSVAYIALAAAFVVWGLRAAGLTAREALVPNDEDVASVRRAAVALRGRLQGR